VRRATTDTSIVRRPIAFVLSVSLAVLAGAPTASAAPTREPRTVARSLPAPVACVGCWAPPAVTSWQWQLQGDIDTSVDAQMFDVDGFEVSRATVQALHDQSRVVVCYISAGSWERWRPDAGDFPDAVKGASNGWPGERWLDIRKLRILRPIMRARLDLCAAKGFDAVEFDNVDGYQNRTGFPLTGGDQLRYNVFLANQAHRWGMSAVLKNDLSQVRDLLPYFDVALDEQCFQYDECNRLRPFVSAGKAVFTVEYRLPLAGFCPEAADLGFNSMKKRLGLGVWRRPCP
jgi:hypothetical protein